MTYFKRHNSLNWIIIILLILILSALITIIYNMYTHKPGLDGPAFKPEFLRKEDFLKAKLNLNDDQVKQFKGINEKQDVFRKNMMSKMRMNRQKIDSFMMLDNPDTAKISSAMKDLTDLQTAMIKEHINSYLAMKKVCNPEQQKKLADIFKNMLIHKMQNRQMMHRGERQDEMPPRD